MSQYVCQDIYSSAYLRVVTIPCCRLLFVNYVYNYSYIIYFLLIIT
jgi:hypothetical protein